MSELLIKTPSAVAIADELTTVVDWVNIQLVAGFTIMVKNAGGGSANDITDIQIDTSADGGLTSSLDQHAGVPAVPVSDGATAVGTFTDTSNFLRIRATCADGEDTTCECWLLADTVNPRLCTLSDIKDRLGLSTTDYDNLINRIILGVEGLFNHRTGRSLIRPVTDVTEYYTGRGNYLSLDRYPIIGEPVVKEAWDYDFDSATALTAGEDYRILKNGRSGLLWRIPIGWPDREDSIQIVYRGGYLPAGVTAEDGVESLPAQLREVAIEQASFLFKRRDDIGLSSVGFEGGSFNKFAPLGLLPGVEEVLKSYCNKSYF